MPVVPTLVQSLLRRLHLLPVPVLDAFAAPLFGRALALAVRRGVFERLAEAPAEAEHIALSCGLDPGAAGMLLDACTAAGYLRHRNGRYALRTPARRWLLRSSPAPLTAFVAYVESRYARWNSLEHSLSAGTPRAPYEEELSPAEWDLYVSGMADLARVLLPRVLPRIRLPGAPRRGLDLGGSHGLYAAALCRRHPGLTMTVLDDARTAPQARRLLAGVPGAARVELRAADVLRDSLPGGQDVILLFNLIHVCTAGQNAELFRRCREALTPGGRIMVLEQFRGGRTGRGVDGFLPPLVGLHLLNESGGRTWTVEDIRAWCPGARRVRRRGIGLPGAALVEVIR